MSREILIAMFLLASATNAMQAHAAADAQSTPGASDATGTRSASASATPSATANRLAQATSTNDDSAKANATETKPEAANADPAESNANAKDEVKTLSGISILGNQEAPKSLVIVPWKSSEIGDMPGLSRLLDDSVQPVDKEVFMRELDYYEIRSSSR